MNLVNTNGTGTNAEGIPTTNGKYLTASNVKFSEGLGITVSFWFKGSITDSSDLIRFEQGGADPITVRKQGDEDLQYLGESGGDSHTCSEFFDEWSPSSSVYNFFSFTI